MTHAITGQELEGCPHCGEKPVHIGWMTPSSPDSPADYNEEIYCNSNKCKELYIDDIVAWWNTRAHEAELDELRRVKREYDALRYQLENLYHTVCGSKNAVIASLALKIKLEELLK